MRCRLPKPNLKPPCSGRVYARLVGFLEGVFGEGERPGKHEAVTPSSGRKRTVDGKVKVAGETAEQGTPRRTADTFLGKIKASAGKGKTSSGHEPTADGQAPSYTSRLIRKLCNKFSTNDAIPHVYAGTCVVLKLSSRWPILSTDEEAEDSLQDIVTPLTIAIFLMVLTRMQTAKMLNARDYVKVVLRAVEVLEYGGGRKGVEQWVRRINTEKWGRDQEWFQNVPEGVLEFNISRLQEDGDLSDDEADETDVDLNLRSEQDEEDEDEVLSSRRWKSSRVGQEEDDPEDVLLPGLATMMRDSFDFLSVERVKEYEKWKKAFLLKLDKVDGTPAATPAKARAHTRLGSTRRSVTVK
jgi:hypothetical protein